ncbi:MAG TPA: ABC transporter permease [Chitinophagaceae bacterium]|nr:ABC transporter permease [Chitinophagaceae bacterium]
MLKNYFKIAWRNIIKSKFYSVVNIIGLSTGIAFTLLIGAYIWSALQVNSSLKNENNQYIIQSTYGNDPTLSLTTVGNLAKALKEQYPGLVANYYRWDGITSTVSKGDKHFREGIQINDSAIFSMYGFPVLYGDAKTAFNDPFSAVVTEDIAGKYFSKTNVIGQTITIDNFSGNKHDFMITAVLKSLPDNSVTKVNDNNVNGILLPLASANFFNRQIDSWNNPWILNYVELQKGVKPKQLEQPMHYLITHNTPVGISDQMHTVLISLNDYYLQANNNLVQRMLYTLSFIAAFILLMAIINFINISISRASSRMKEIGVRKVLGGMRRQLVLQFLTESVLLVFFAILLSLFIYQLARPYFSSVLDKEIPGVFSFPLYMYSIPLASAIIIGVLGGIYPALVLSSLKSAEVIKGKLTSVKENIFLRKSLVAFQFCIAAVVLIGSMIISKQINYFFGKDLGYDKEYMLSAQVPRDWSARGVAQMETIRNEIAAMPQISNATLSYEIPNGNNGSGLAYKPGQDSTAATYTELFTADENYATTYKVPMAAGSFFNSAETYDSSKIVINETFAKTFGWKNAHDAINQQIKLQGYGNIIFTVSGVVKDFHLWSMQGSIPSMTFVNVKLSQSYRYLSFRIKPGNVGEAVAALQKRWSALMPGAPFEYTFMDETLAKIYKSEIQLKKASYTATVLALIIVLLGVLGLISLSVQKRTKEIGIRKVLGSSVAGIMSLFLKEFLLVILIAGVVACPLAYLVMDKWLQAYAYRINITAQPFLLSVFVLGCITAVLICIQTIKVALANPVESLRTE